MKIYHWKTLYTQPVCHVDNTHANSELYDTNHHAIRLTTDRVMTQFELESTLEWRELLAEMQPYTLITQIIGDNIMAFPAITPDLIERLIAIYQQVGLDVKGLTEAKDILAKNQGDLATLTTTDKSSVVNAINEVKSQVSKIDLTVLIDDSVESAGKTWSSQKIVAELQGKFDAIINGAPGTLDTLKEISVVLQNNPEILNTIQGALAKAVRVDKAQAFNEVEQAQGRANIGAASVADLTQVNENIGDIEALSAKAYTDARDGVSA